MTAAADPPLSGLRARALRVGLVLGAVLAVAVASWVSVPMVPAPMTLQTLAVFAIAGLAGPRLTFEIVLVWLLCAAIGLPVLEGFSGGWQVLIGPTAGFLLGLLIAGPLVARFTPKAKGGDLFALILAGHCLVLLTGWAWLAINLGAGPAFMGGVRPFFAGVIAKSVTATIIVMLAKARFAKARKTP